MQAIIFQYFVISRAHGVVPGLVRLLFHINCMVINVHTFFLSSILYSSPLFTHHSFWCCCLFKSNLQLWTGEQNKKKTLEIGCPSPLLEGEISPFGGVLPVSPFQVWNLPFCRMHCKSYVILNFVQILKLKMKVYIILTNFFNIEAFLFKHYTWFFRFLKVCKNSNILVIWKNVAKKLFW